MPVLTIAGSASAGEELDPSIRPLAEQVRGVVTEEFGYYLAEERPERLTEELLRFFEEAA